MNSLNGAGRGSRSGAGRHGFGMAIVASALLAIVLVASKSEAPPSGAAVTVDAEAPAGTITARLGTQFTWGGLLDQAATRQRFADLAAPLVRIDATSLGPGALLPAGVKEGVWDLGSLDAVVGDVHRAGGETVLTIAYAPEWMWNCGAGQIRDGTFGEFGDYMARLVSYYNTGSFVTERGIRVTNPAGDRNRITYWELWNEPDQQATCPPAVRLAPNQYVAMWNATVPKMLAVDPTIKLVGPATSHAITTSLPDYIPALLAGAGRKPDAISFHGYGGWLNTQTDRFLFDGEGTAFGLDGIERNLTRVKAMARGIPVWITELNVNSAWDEEDPAGRPWSDLGAAWGASAFRRLALAGADAIIQYQFAHPKLRQFSLVDVQSGDPLLPYWRDYYLARYFPPGSVLLSTSSNRTTIEALAARAPGSTSVRVLIVNRQPQSERGSDGRGQAASVQVSVGNLNGVTKVTVRILDSTTPLVTGPPEQTVSADGLRISLAGYGAALVEFDTEG